MGKDKANIPLSRFVCKSVQVMSKELTIRELPKMERPYEKCEKYGVKVLSDAELLAVVIKCGTAGESSVSIATKLLNQNPKDPSLLGICHLSLEQLMEVRGIGRVKAIQLKCVAELAKRMSKLRAKEKLVLDCPKSIADYFMEDLRHQEQEHMVVAFFDTKNHLLGEKTMTIGTVNSSLVSPREIFLEALNKRAVSIVLLHNHPSGDVTPSREDLKATERVHIAGEYIGISVLDHIIIGNGCYFSFREEGMI